MAQAKIKPLDSKTLLIGVGLITAVVVASKWWNGKGEEAMHNLPRTVRSW